MSNSCDTYLLRWIISGFTAYRACDAAAVLCEFCDIRRRIWLYVEGGFHSNRRRPRPHQVHLNLDAAKLIGHAPVSTQLDYCNFLVYGSRPISQNTSGISPLHFQYKLREMRLNMLNSWITIIPIHEGSHSVRLFNVAASPTSKNWANTRYALR